jgi:hypothetical protein
MYRQVVGVLVAIAAVCLPNSVDAQVVDSDIALFDPPETEYFTGALDTDPAIERGLPITEPHRAFLPVAVDLSSRMPTVGNQGRSSSCAAWSTAYAARSYYTSALERRDVLKPENLPSPSYIYHLARAGGCDDGTNIPRTVDVLKRGALSLADYPFTPECAAPASPQLVARAHDFRVRGMRRVDIGRLDDIKGQLARFNPVIIRMVVSPAFKRWRGAGTFAEVAPALDEKAMEDNWHFMTLVGYDDQRQAFRLINSWGPGWGDQGYAWVSYGVFRTRLVSHAYMLDVGLSPPTTITQVSPKPPPLPPRIKSPPVVTKVVPTQRPPLQPPVLKPIAPPATPVAIEPVRPVPVTRPGVALVVGNGAYSDGRLATTIADAAAVAETLRAAGYNVTELHDVRQAQIGRVLRDFLDQVAAAGPDAVAFFYFAGRAAQSAGRNYLVPVDALILESKDVALQALGLDNLVAELARLPSAARVVVLDAARDHGYGRGTSELVQPGLANMAAPGGMLIAFSAAPGRVAADDAAPNSLYTTTLVRSMRTAGLDLERIFKMTRLQVNHASQGRQTPWTAESLTVDVTLFQTSSQLPQAINLPPAKPVSPPPSMFTPVTPAPVPATPVQRLQLADLDKLACARVSVRARGRQSVLSGYVASDEDLKLVKSIAAGLPGVSVGDVIVTPWPQCEALQTLEKPLALADRPTIDIGPRAELRNGDQLNIQIRAPSQISYVYVAYIQADGSVVELVQPTGVVPQPTLPGQTLVFGSGEQGKPKFTIGPPFGREMIIAIASRSPLFEHELPAMQTEREFLSELRRALLYKPDPDMPDRELAASIKTLHTQMR